MVRVDVVGVGLNATDTVLTVPQVPPLGGKERIGRIDRQAGGQVSTALVTCQRLGLRTRYIGKLGDDGAGRLQLASLRQEGVDIRHVRRVRNTPTQVGVVIVDQRTGERTVYWARHPRLALSPSEVSVEAIRSARALLIDGCDVAAALKAARSARKAGIPVVADLDTVYTKVECLFPFTDYLVASSNFMPAVTGQNDPFRALQFMAREYMVRAAGMTLGSDGALVYTQGRFHYSPGFLVATIDTTGAGDVFHGAFVYAVLAGWEMGRSLEFSNAMAALNCTARGARGGIATRKAAERLIATGGRHVNRALVRASSARVYSGSRPAPPRT
jgi:sugar/nucleoside kinase (ribokinase family)